MIRCYACMEEYKDVYDMCPYCGCEKDCEPKQMYFLRPGMVIGNRYEIGISVGEGGFGITYKAWDKMLSQVVAIKEYFPSGLVNRTPGEKNVIVYSGSMKREYENGKARFLEEAQNMAKFDKHPNIVNVYDFFEENGTAYIVMEFLDGINYKEYIKNHDGKIAVDEAVKITKDMLFALLEVHKSGILHRDISPDNIFMCNDGRIKLIDFGAARFSSVEEARTRSVVLKRGFAPPEQYQTKSKQGPWTDIYALGATLYRAISGVVPEESVNRTQEDLLVEPKELCPEISQNLNNIILRSMALQSELRFQNATEFLKALETTAKIRDAKRELKRRKMRRVFTIAGACAVILAGVFVCVQMTWSRKDAAAVLDEAAVSIWVAVESVEEEKQSFEEALREFKTEYPQIALDIQYIEEADYESTLREAIEQDNLPVLFESNCLGGDDYSYLGDISKIFQYITTEEYFFYNDYKKYYPHSKQLPLAFSVPVIYTNTLMTEDRDIEQIITDGDYQVTANNYVTYYNLYSENEVVKDLSTLPTRFEAYVADENCQATNTEFIDGKSACLISDVSDYNIVQQNLAGIYEVHLLEELGIVGSFQDCFSISKEATREEQAAAIQILVYLLSDNAQDIRYVQNGKYLPVNQSVFDSYIDINHELADLEKGFAELIMAGESQNVLNEWYAKLVENR